MGKAFFLSKEVETEDVIVLLWISPVQALPCPWLPCFHVPGFPVSMKVAPDPPLSVPCLTQQV